MREFDLAIVGSGPGGYVAAIRAGTLGLKTVLIEADRYLGGTCLHRGCIPTKALLHTAYLYDEVKKVDRYGIKIDGHRLDLVRVQSSKTRVVKKLAKGIEYLMNKRKVEVMKGRGSLLGKSRISVQGEKEEEIRAAKIILATGSQPSSPPGLEPDGKQILNSDHILELKEVPRRLAVVGAGAVGVEFASIFSSFGSEVTLIELMPRILPLEDEEVSQVLTKALLGRGISIATSTEVASVNKEKAGVKLELRTASPAREGDKQQEGRSITADCVLVSVGRKPVTGAIGLEEVGVETDRGFVVVDEYMQTTARDVYAIGDVVATAQLAHVASAEGLVAVAHLSGRPVQPLDYRSIPACTYSRPEVASVGLTEIKARQEGYEVVVGRFPFSASGKAAILGEQEGMVKIVSEKRYNEILGVHIVGPKATELIAEAAALLRMEATVEELTGTVHAHPTLSEAMMEAAHDVYGRAIHI